MYDNGVDVASFQTKATAKKRLKQAGTYPNGLLQKAAPMVNAALTS
jgi:hypothetical protein